MGGLGIGTVASVGALTTSLIGRNQQISNQKKQLKYMSENIASQTRNRKNLLEQQLASRRAQLGGMGITGSSSSLAAQKRMVGDAYNDIADSASSYRRSYEDLQDAQAEDLRNRLGTAITTVTDKMIK